MHNRLFRLSAFAALYFVQGVGLAYFSNFQKPYLTRYGIDADVIGLLTGLLLVPFILKIFIGMVSDQVNLFGMGYRKPYIILGLVLAAGGFAAAGFVDPGEQFLLYAAAVLLGSFAVTLFDTTTDGMAVDITPRPDQPLVQGVMTGGKASGFILLSFIFGQIAGSFGFRAVFVIIAVAMLLPLFWVLQMEEPSDRSPDEVFEWRAFSVMKQPRFLWFAAFALVQSFVQFGIDGLPTFYMAAEFGAPDELIGLYGTLRGFGALGGAVLTTLLVGRIGRQTSAYLSMLLIAGFGAAFAFAGGAQTVLWMGLLWGIAWGFHGTVIIAITMDLTDSRIAASMFAIVMGVINLGTALGEAIGTSLTDNIGFQNVFLLFAALVIVEVALALRLFHVAPEIGTPSTEVMPAK